MSSSLTPEEQLSSTILLSMPEKANFLSLDVILKLLLAGISTTRLLVLTSSDVATEVAKIVRVSDPNAMSSLVVQFRPAANARLVRDKLMPNPKAADAATNLRFIFIGIILII